MPLLNIDPQVAENAPEWSGGNFPIAKAGIGLPFEVLGDDKKPDYLDAKPNDDGVTNEDFVVRLSALGEEDQEITHTEFFRLNEDWGIGKWKSFLNALHGRNLTGAEIAAFDTDALIGVRFTADVVHKQNKKDPSRVNANIDYKTIALEGGPLETPQEAPKPAKPARPASRR